MKSDNEDNEVFDPRQIFSKTPKELDKEVQNGMKEFNKLLDSLSSLHDRKKALWKQIYENAVVDRRNAYIMFTDLYQKVHNNPTEHAIHGMNLSKYLERLNKSNEQLIQLAQILDEAVENEEDDLMDQDRMYARLENRNNLNQDKEKPEDKEK